MKNKKRRTAMKRTNDTPNTLDVLSAIEAGAGAVDARHLRAIAARLDHPDPDAIRAAREVLTLMATVLSGGKQ